MFSKNTLILVLCMLAVAFSQCPRNCTSCPNPTSCDTCSAGNFVVNGSFCAPCPIGCSSCAPGPDGRPVCSACIGSGQLGPDGRCFQCDPSCETCSGFPRNCTSCPDGKELIFANNTSPNRTNSSNASGTVGSCGSITGCPIQRCGQCTPPDPQNTTYCRRCLPGYFPYMQSCFPCAFPCAACDFNPNLVWTQIAPLIQEIVVMALRLANMTTNISSLPPFVNHLDFANMTDDLRRGWSQAFFVARVLAPAYPNPLDLISSIPRHIQFFVSIQSLSWPNQERAILQRINTVLNRTWTLQELYNRTGQVAAGFAQCANCLNGFQAGNNGTCDRCPPNCLECSAGSCSVCREGFFESGGVCNPCTPPCATCDTSATSCTRCNPPLSLVSSTCIQCAEPCATCSAANVSSCTTCKRPFSLTADSGTCFRCNQDLCVECQPGNASICLECRFGATLVDGRCQFCPANCSSCSSGSPPTCFECLSGYKLVALGNNTLCLPCGPGCIRCSDESCLECQPGTFLNADTGRCQRCKQGCKECTSLEVCTLSQNGVVIINGNVITCNPGCKACDTSPNQCTECEQRFFLSGNLCRPCEQGCKVCSDATTCTQCLENLHLDSGNCSRCAGNCRTCDSSNLTSCQSCKRGFTLVGTQCLRQCGRGCLECEPGNSSICITCGVGHSLRPDGRCIKCLGSCSGSCDPRNISICLTCVNGFELRNNKCERCPIGCSDCRNGDCSDCVPGFRLSQRTNGSFFCAERCRPPCASCSGRTCLACQTGFSLSNGRCTPDLSCNPSCDFCPPGTEPGVNGSCTRCPTNCSACSSGTCAQCQEGFYLNAGACTQCIANCTTCFNRQSCGFCAPGYVKEIMSMDSGISDATFSDRCIPCDPNCATCAVQPERCTSCPEGTRLFSSKCAGMFTVQATFELNIPYATFLENSESQSFGQAVSRQCGVSSGNIFFNSVREGSTVISTTVSTSDQTQASTVQSRLGSGSVTGYSVLSSSVDVYYGDSQYTAPAAEQQQKAAAKATNVGLIVGVVVGGVVLIAVVSFLIYKFKCKKNIPISTEDQSAIVAKQEN